MGTVGRKPNTGVGADPGDLIMLFWSPITATPAVKAITTTKLLHNDPR